MNSVSITTSTKLNGTARAKVCGISIASGGGGTGAYQSFLGITASNGTLNNFTGRIGWRFTPTANMTVRSLGRWKTSGNSGSTTVRLQTSTGSDLGTVTVNLSAGTAGTMVYTSLGSPVSLSSGTVYAIVSDETNGGNYWENTGMTPNFNLTHIGTQYSVYGTGTSGTLNDVTSGSAYVPTGFTYDVP